MAVARARDPDEVRARFARWLVDARGAPARIRDFTTPSGGGMSSETYLVEVVDDTGEPSRLVLRLPPPGGGLFPTYDLEQQARVLDALHEATDVPVPRVLACEADPAALGAPFLVMEHVAGSIPTDQPSYLAAGWVVDRSPDDQRRLQRGFLASLAHVHRVPWADLGLDELARPGSGSPLARDLAWWGTYIHWAAAGAAAAAVRDALAWCEDRLPDVEPAPSLLWGDVRIPNVVFDDDLAPAAILDWEMAGIGPAEVDLGWWLAIHRMSVAVAGRDLPGFMHRDDALAWYEQHLARPLERAALHWYETYGALRSAAIMVRMTHLLHDAGAVPDLTLAERNPCTALLRELLAGG